MHDLRSLLWLLLVCWLSVPTSWAQTTNSTARLEAATSATYACPMHTDVTATKPGQCTKCEMALKAMETALTDEFIVRTDTVPQQIKPGQKTALRFAILHPGTQQQVKDFHIQHEKPFHLFIVSSDLQHFEHLHPTQQTDGSFTIATVFPQAGMYHLLADIFPVGGVAHVVHQTLVTTGFRGNAVELRARLQPDQVTTKTVDGLQITLKTAPEKISAAQRTMLRYQLTDAKTGQPVTDLQPYLGAWGHTLILSEDAADYLHSHPLESHLPKSGASPNTIYFETYFPHPGHYRIWSQFQRNNQIITVFFTVAVESVD